MNPSTPTEARALRIDLPWPARDLHPNAVAQLIGHLRSVMSYNPQTGVLIRIKKTGQNVEIGKEAGWTDAQGYRRVRFMGRSPSAHRLAWAHFYGEVPPPLIDHINGNRADNRISNLRAATRSINTQNLKRARSDNRLGILGVRERRGRFEARIMIDGRAVQIGSFPTSQEASFAYLEKKREMHEGGTL
jgi:hypothetical protein